jgi:hypothetical protein
VAIFKDDWTTNKEDKRKNEKINMRTLLITLTLISFATFGQTDKKQRQGEPDIYNVESDDKEMNEAIKKSRLTFDDFLTKFKNKKRNQSNFSVKMPLY